MSKPAKKIVTVYTLMCDDCIDGQDILWLETFGSRELAADYAVQFCYDNNVSAAGIAEAKKLYKSEIYEVHAIRFRFRLYNQEHKVKPKQLHIG